MSDIRNMANVDHVDEVVARFPWWSGARLAMVRAKGVEGVDEFTRLIALMHPAAAIAPESVDVERLTYMSSDDLIDRFLHRGAKRIVAEEGDAEDMSMADLGDDGDMVSEELAEIYLNQGLYEQAIDTYRKLSLVNSKKSIYFAELIEEISKKMTK
jgi:tetratricopeptide (TPR) repeat protein